MFYKLFAKDLWVTAVSVLWYFCRLQKYSNHNHENLLLPPLFCCCPSADGHGSHSFGDYFFQHLWEHIRIPQLLPCSVNFPVWPSGSHSSICTHHLSWDWSPLAATHSTLSESEQISLLAWAWISHSKISDVQILQIIQSLNNKMTAQAGCLWGGVLDKENPGLLYPYSVSVQNLGCSETLLCLWVFHSPGWATGPSAFGYAEAQISFHILLSGTSITQSSACSSLHCICTPSNLH